MDDGVPSYFSARRAMFLTGAGRKRVEALPKHGPLKLVSRTDVEHRLLLGRRITVEDWDRVTVEIERAGRAAREAA